MSQWQLQRCRLLRGELQDEDDDKPAPPLPATPPPRAPSPIGIGARLPVRNHQRPQDWWKLSPAQLVDNADDSDEHEKADTIQAECFSAGPVHPRSFADAMCRDNAAEWKTAALAKLDAHKTNATWILVPCPKDRPVIASKWIFTQKYHADGSFERYKGRLVTQGFSQRPGFKYLEIFAVR